ncbi:MAG: helix-turn-helix domain-containing protein [Nanoarchaeota archaeon]
MPKNPFLLVSLKENKAKELAQVISNPSCRQILDYLANNEDATETDLSKKLNIPISTVHYNIKHLLSAGLVLADEYHYSEKGKEVNHYKLANKYIIIAPRSTYGIKEKLRSILPVSILALASAGLIQMYNSFKAATFKVMEAAPNAMTMGAQDSVLKETMIEKAAEEGAAVMHAVADESAKTFVERMPDVTATVPNYALWFLFGCVFVIVLIVVFEIIKAKRQQ